VRVVNRLDGTGEASGNIGALIKYIRKSSGMTQTKLSQKIGISYQQVQKYEKGTSELTLSRLKQLADALGVPVSTFIGEMENHRPLLSDDDVRALTLLREIESCGLKPVAMRVLQVLAGGKRRT
jgi:transcriptional regulator with XRE-family HTH domain